MRWLVFAVCACSTPPPAARIRTEVPPQVYCPSWQTAVVGELFPGCGDLPLAGIPCGHAACERPCSAEIESTKGGHQSITFAYDAAGHYLTSRGETADPMTCTYEGGKRVRCASPHASIIIERDGRGRIAKLLEEHASGEYEEKPVAYDRAGRVRRVGTATYEYDASGRLIRADGTKLVWKDNTEVTGKWLGRDAVFQYDGDRLARIELAADSSQVRFTWEDARLVALVVLGPGGATTTTYGYDCR
jgi:hypothetical protein